jgi:hypothetical protein
MVATAITEVRVLEFAPGAQRELGVMPCVARWLTDALTDVPGLARELQPA